MLSAFTCSWYPIKSAEAAALLVRDAAIISNQQSATPVAIPSTATSPSRQTLQISQNHVAAAVRGALQLAASIPAYGITTVSAAGTLSQQWLQQYGVPCEPVSQLPAEQSRRQHADANEQATGPPNIPAENDLAITRHQQHQQSQSLLLLEPKCILPPAVSHAAMQSLPSSSGATATECALVSVLPKDSSVSQHTNMHSSIAAWKAVLAELQNTSSQLSRHSAPQPTTTSLRQRHGPVSALKTGQAQSRQGAVATWKCSIQSRAPAACDLSAPVQTCQHVLSEPKTAPRLSLAACQLALADLSCAAMPSRCMNATTQKRDRSAGDSSSMQASGRITARFSSSKFEGTHQHSTNSGGCQLTVSASVSTVGAVPDPLKKDRQGPSRQLSVSAFPQVPCSSYNAAPTRISHASSAKMPGSLRSEGVENFTSPSSPQMSSSNKLKPEYAQLQSIDLPRPDLPGGAVESNANGEEFALAAAKKAEAMPCTSKPAWTCGMLPAGNTRHQCHSFSSGDSVGAKACIMQPHSSAAQSRQDLAVEGTKVASKIDNASPAANSEAAELSEGISHSTPTTVVQDPGQDQLPYKNSGWLQSQTPHSNVTAAPSAATTATSPITLLPKVVPTSDRLAKHRIHTPRPQQQHPNVASAASDAPAMSTSSEHTSAFGPCGSLPHSTLQSGMQLTSAVTATQSTLPSNSSEHTSLAGSADNFAPATRQHGLSIASFAATRPPARAMAALHEPHWQPLLTTSHVSNNPKDVPAVKSTAALPQQTAHSQLQSKGRAPKRTALKRLMAEAVPFLIDERCSLFIENDEDKRRLTRSQRRLCGRIEPLVPRERKQKRTRVSQLQGSGKTPIDAPAMQTPAAAEMSTNRNTNRPALIQCTRHLNNENRGDTSHFLPVHLILHNVASTTPLCV